MDAGGLYGQHELLKYGFRSSPFCPLLSIPVHSKTFFKGTITVFFNCILLFLISSYIFSKTVDEPEKSSCM